MKITKSMKPSLSLAAAMGTFAVTAAVANAAITVTNSDSALFNDTLDIKINDFAISSSNELLIVTIGNEYGNDNMGSVTFGGVAMVLQTKNVGTNIRQTFI